MDRPARMRAYHDGAGFPVERIVTTDLVVYALKGHRALRRELVEFFQVLPMTQERSHFCVYCGSMFIWDARTPCSHFARTCTFIHVDPSLARTLKTQAQAGYDALRISNASRNARDHLTHATAHLSAKVTGAHDSVELLRVASDHQAAEMHLKLDNIIVKINGSAGEFARELPVATVCSTCFGEYSAGEFIHCDLDPEHRICLTNCAPNSRECLIENSGHCVYVPCTGTMSIRGGSSESLISWWLAVSMSIHEKKVIADENSHRAFLSQLPIEEKIFQDAVKLMSLACPNSQCAAPAVLDSGCAAMKCTRCELAYCAACFYVMPPRALDGQHTGEPLSFSF
jgi:hypothetical protein